MLKKAAWIAAIHIVTTPNTVPNVCLSSYSCLWNSENKRKHEWRAVSREINSEVDNSHTNPYVWLPFQRYPLCKFYEVAQRLQSGAFKSMRKWCTLPSQWSRSFSTGLVGGVQGQWRARIMLSEEIGRKLLVWRADLNRYGRWLHDFILYFARNLLWDKQCQVCVYSEY